MRVAYIGAGRFSTGYIFPHLAENDVELAAICDLDAGKAELARARFGFGQVYTDFERMLGEVGPDAVFCVGGPYVHYAVGRRVLELGFPLYVQKPPAPSVAETEQMAELAEAKGVVCHVGFNLRSSPAVQAAKAAIADESFGPTRSGYFRYGLSFGRRFVDALWDQHCHLFDLARYMMGDAAFASAIRNRQPDSRDYSVLAYGPNGQVVTIAANGGHAIRDGFIYMEVAGDGHYLTWDAARELTVWGGGHAQRRCPPAWGVNPDLEWLGYKADVANFLAAAAGREPDRCPIAAALATMRLVDQAREALGLPAFASAD